MRALALALAAFALWCAPAAAGEPFEEADLATLFEMSKTACSQQCSYKAFTMVRLPLPESKRAFLITFEERFWCGSSGCASMVVVVSGNRFVPVKEGIGISKNEAISLALGEGGADSLLADRPSFDCAKATSASARLICSDAELRKADGALGIKFRALAGKDEVTKRQLTDKQLSWLRERNARCGVGPDKARVPTPELAPAKPCMLEAINKRIAELQALEGGAVTKSAEDSSSTIGSTASRLPTGPTFAEWRDRCNDEWRMISRGSNRPTPFYLAECDPSKAPKPSSASAVTGYAVFHPVLEKNPWGFGPYLYGFKFRTNSSGVEGTLLCFTWSGEPAELVQNGAMSLGFVQNQTLAEIALDVSRLHQMLIGLRREAELVCGNAVAAREYSLRQNNDAILERLPDSIIIGSSLLQGYVRKGDTNWTIVRNYYEEELAKRKAELAEQRRQEAQRRSEEERRRQLAAAPTEVVGDEIHPNVQDVLQCVRDILQKNTCPLSIKAVRQQDRLIEGLNGVVIAEVDLVALHPFAGCSPAAMNCTGTCWDMDPRKVQSQNGAFAIGQVLRIEKSVTFKKFEKGWRCLMEEIKPVEKGFYLKE